MKVQRIILSDKKKTYQVFLKLRNDKNSYFHEKYLDKDSFELILSLISVKCNFCHCMYPIFKDDIMCHNCKFLISRKNGNVDDFFLKSKNSKYFLIKLDVKFPEYESTNSPVRKNDISCDSDVIVEYVNFANYDNSIIICHNDSSGDIFSINHYSFYKKEIEYDHSIRPSRDILSRLEFGDVVEYVDIIVGNRINRFFINSKIFNLSVIMYFAFISFVIKPSIQTKITGCFIYPGMSAPNMLMDRLWCKLMDLFTIKDTFVYYPVLKSYEKLFIGDDEDHLELIPKNQTLYWVYNYGMLRLEN